MDIPSSSIDPEVGGINPVSIRMVVDLPAPFGPRKPKKQPRGTVRLSPSTAALFPYTFRRSRTDMAGESLSMGFSLNGSASSDGRGHQGKDLIQTIVPPIAADT